MRKVLAVIICLSFYVSCVYADTIYLKNGDVIKGKIDETTETSVFIKDDSGGWQKISKSDINNMKQDGDTDQSSLWYCMHELAFKWGITSLGTRSLNGHVNNTVVNGNPSYSVDQAVSSSAAFSFEYVKYLTLNFGLGVGFTGMGNLSVRTDNHGDETGDFEFMPMYIIIKMRSDPVRHNQFLFRSNSLHQNRYFYGVCHLGRNMYWQRDGFNSATKSGIYFAGGAGFQLRHMQIEALYSINTANSKASFNDNGVIYNYDVDVAYQSLGVNIGFVF